MGLTIRNLKDLILLLNSFIFLTSLTQIATAIPNIYRLSLVHSGATEVAAIIVSCLTVITALVTIVSAVLGVAVSRRGSTQLLSVQLVMQILLLACESAITGYYINYKSPLLRSLTIQMVNNVIASGSTASVLLLLSLITSGLLYSNSREKGTSSP